MKTCLDCPAWIEYLQLAPSPDHKTCLFTKNFEPESREICSRGLLVRAVQAQVARARRAERAAGAAAASQIEAFLAWAVGELIVPMRVAEEFYRNQTKR